MIKVQRAENVRMQAFLAANGIQAVPRWETAGSMKHVWRLYAKGVPWTEELARRLTDLGFLGWDGEPLGRFSGNGGMFSVFVRGHEELVNGEPETMKQNKKAEVAPAECGQHTPTRWDWSDLQAILNNAGEHLRDSSPASSERCFEAAKRLTQLKTAHDQLVSALQAMVNLWPAKAHQANPQHPIHQARAALAQAQKGAL